MNEMDDFLDALRDPFWLAKEFTRLRTLEDKRFHAHVDEQLALCKRVGEQIDSVHALVTVAEG